MIIPAGVRYVSLPPGSGYGDSAEQYVRGLRARGLPVNARVHRALRRSVVDHPGHADAITYDTTLLHSHPTSFAEQLEPESERPNIAYTSGRPIGFRTPGTRRSNHSTGQLDWLPRAYPFLVDYKLVPTSADDPDAYGFPVEENAHWARADAAHASELMRQGSRSRASNGLPSEPLFRRQLRALRRQRGPDAIAGELAEMYGLEHSLLEETIAGLRDLADRRLIYWAAS